jgi:hypothetical protein
MIFFVADGCDKGLAAHKQCANALNKLIFTDAFYNYTISSVEKGKQVAKLKAENFEEFSKLFKVPLEEYFSERDYNDEE